MSDLVTTISTFFPKLEGVGGLVGALTGHRKMRVIVELRGTDTRILLDLRGDECRVTVGGPGLDGEVGMAGTPEDLHEIFTGRLAIMAAIARRVLLLRGSMGSLVAMFPVLGQIPVMYGEHLESEDPAPARPGPLRRMFGAAIDRIAGLFGHVVGKIVGRMEASDAVEAVSALSAGAAAFSGRIEVHRSSSSAAPDGANPLDKPLKPLAMRLFSRLFHWKLYWAGWFVSLFKNVLKVPVDVFATLEKLSDGASRS